MSTDTFHVIEGYTYDTTATTQRLEIPGFIDGITTDSDPDPEVIHRAQAAVLAHFGAFGTALAGHTSLTLQHIVCRGVSNNSCSVRVIFENPFFGGPPSTIILRDRSYLGSITTNTITRVATNQRFPILVNGGDFVDSDGANVHMKDDYAEITYPRPMRCIQAYALTYGAPANNGQDAVGYVNNATWRGLPIGYWLVSEFETDISRFSGYYTMTAAAVTKITEDWSHLSYLRSERTGKYMKVDQADIDALMAPPYANDTNGITGATRSGPHPLYSLPFVFGIN